MTTTEHVPPGAEANDNVHLDAVIENLNSLGNIIEDIASKINHQVLGNCDTLTYLEAKLPQSSTIVLKDNGDQVTLKAFQASQIDMLIKSPLRLALGRLGGLRKIIAQIQDQVAVK